MSEQKYWPVISIIEAPNADSLIAIFGWWCNWSGTTEMLSGYI